MCGGGGGGGGGYTGGGGGISIPSPAPTPFNPSVPTGPSMPGPSTPKDDPMKWPAPKTEPLKIPDSLLNPAPAPAPTPAPAPEFSAPDPTESAAQRLKRLNLLRMGLSKTIHTSPQGVTGSPLTSTPSAYSPGVKGKLGQ